jgi:hypothetical protein
VKYVLFEMGTNYKNDDDYVRRIWKKACRRRRHLMSKKEKRKKKDLFIFLFFTTLFWRESKKICDNRDFYCFSDQYKWERLKRKRKKKERKKGKLVIYTCIYATCGFFFSFTCSALYSYMHTCNVSSLFAQSPSFRIE